MIKTSPDKLIQFFGVVRNYLWDGFEKQEDFDKPSHICVAIETCVNQSEFSHDIGKEMSKLVHDYIKNHAFASIWINEQLGFDLDREIPYCVLQGIRVLIIDQICANLLRSAGRVDLLPSQREKANRI